MIMALPNCCCEPSGQDQRTVNQQRSAGCLTVNQKNHMSALKVEDCPVDGSMITGCRKYEWIVKGGEEVRIDQRIEQLFDVMNGLMQRQPGAAAHSLQV